MTEASCQQKFFHSNYEFLFFCTTMFVILCINTLLEWQVYSKITTYPYYQTKADIKSVNIRHKENKTYSAMEFESIDGYKFYSAKSYSTESLNEKTVLVIFDTSKLTFMEFLKGFRTKTYEILPVQTDDNSLKKQIRDYISSQHDDERLQKIFVSLFFETRLPDDLQNKINEFGLSAVMSLSGLNLTLLIALIFIISTPLYRFFQDKYFPFRNRKVDILLFALILMIFYAYLADFSKPFVRALVMALILFFLALRGKKLLNIQTLIATLIIIISFSPRSLFSIGLWLSVTGVYYIFLFLHHTQNIKGWKNYILLGIYLFLTMSVVARYMFPTFTLAQLTSPVTSILFDFFYPIEVVLHIFGIGWIFDSILLSAMEISVTKIEIQTADWFFYIFILASLLAYKRRELFFFTAIASSVFAAISIVIVYRLEYT